MTSSCSSLPRSLSWIRSITVSASVSWDLPNAWHMNPFCNQGHQDWLIPTTLQTAPSPPHYKLPHLHHTTDYPISTTLQTAPSPPRYRLPHLHHATDCPISTTLQTAPSPPRYRLPYLFLMLAHLSGTICLKHSATLILPPLSEQSSRCTCLIIISKLFFTALPIPSSDTACVCVVSVIVKRPVLPPHVVNGRSRNPLYYYYYYLHHATDCPISTTLQTALTPPGSYTPPPPPTTHTHIHKLSDFSGITNATMVLAKMKKQSPMIPSGITIAILVPDRKEKVALPARITGILPMSVPVHWGAGWRGAHYPTSRGPAGPWPPWWNPATHTQLLLHARWLDTSGNHNQHQNTSVSGLQPKLSQRSLLKTI